MPTANNKYMNIKSLKELVEDCPHDMRIGHIVNGEFIEFKFVDIDYIRDGKLIEMGGSIMTDEQVFTFLEE